jgi:hypothetical protein
MYASRALLIRVVSGRAEDNVDVLYLRGRTSPHVALDRRADGDYRRQAFRCSLPRDAIRPHARFASDRWLPRCVSRRPRHRTQRQLSMDVVRPTWRLRDSRPWSICRYAKHLLGDLRPPNLPKRQDRLLSIRKDAGLGVDGAGLIRSAKEPIANGRQQMRVQHHVTRAIMPLLFLAVTASPGLAMAASEVPALKTTRW